MASSGPPSTQILTSTRVISSKAQDGNRATTVVIASTRPRTTVINTTLRSGSTVTTTRTSSAAVVSSFRTISGVPTQQTEVVRLTTIFEPPTECAGPSAYRQTVNATSISVNTDCYPQSWAEFQLSASSFYSPGVCPSSNVWFAVQTTIIADEQTETQAWCCPQGMSNTGLLGSSTYCYDSRPLNVAASSAVDAGRFALPISVAWRADDLTSFDPPFAPLTALRNAGYAPAAETSSASATPTQSSSEENELSSGAAAGLGVGITIAVFAIAGILWWYIRYHRSHRTAVDRQAAVDGRQADETVLKAEKDGRERYEADGTQLQPEKDGTERYEIGAGKPAEIEARSLAELDSGWQAAEINAPASRS